MATGFGLRYSRTLHGGNPICARFVVLASDSTALFEGDVVELTPTTGSMDAASEVASITRFTSGHIPLGVIKSFEPSASLPITGNTRVASTLRFVNVNIDPDSVYQAQEDGLGTAITVAGAGSMFNYNLIVAAGSAVTGQSGTMINSDSGASSSAADVKVINCPSNGGTNYVGVSGGAIFEVLLNGQAIRATDSQS